MEQQQLVTYSAEITGILPVANEAKMNDLW